MSIYKHLLETEKNINIIFSTINIETNRLLSEIPKSVISEPTITTKVMEIREIAKSLSDSQKKSIELVNACKQDITQKDLIFLRDYLKNIFSTKFPSLSELFMALKTVKMNNIDTELLTKFNSNCDAYAKNCDYLEELFRRTLNILNNNIDVLVTAGRGPFLNKILYVGFDQSQISEKVKVDKKIINITIINKLTVERLTFITDLNIRNTRERITKYIRDTCNTILNNAAVDSNLEIRLLHIKFLDWKTTQKEIMQLLLNTTINIISAYPALIKSSKANVYLNLINKEKNLGGQYLTYKSNYENIFINITFHESILKKYVLGKISLEPEDTPYINILHELTHAYDPQRVEIIEEDTQYRAYARIFLDGKEPTPNTMALSEMIYDCRLEGLARFSQWLQPSLKNTEYINIIKIRGFFSRYPWAVKNINKFLKNIAYVTNEKITSSETRNIYETGITHEFGEYMTMMIYLAEYEKDIRLILYKKDNIISRMFNIKNNMDTLINVTPNLTEEEFNKYLREHGIATYAVNDIKELFEYMINDKKITYIVTSGSNLKKNLNTFISKISMMNPVQFLNKYEQACEKLHIENTVLNKALFTKIYNDTKKERKIISI